MEKWKKLKKYKHLNKLSNRDLQILDKSIDSLHYDFKDFIFKQAYTILKKDKKRALYITK